MKIRAYCDASYDDKTGAVGLGSTFNKTPLTQENRTCGDRQTNIDANGAELYAISFCMKHVLAEVDDASKVELQIVTDSDDCLRKLQLDKANWCKQVEEIYELNEKFKSVEFIPIKGHCENKGPDHMLNCHVDKMAKRSMREVRDRIHVNPNLASSAQI